MPIASEAILQFETNKEVYPFAAREGFEIIPQYEGASPNYYLTDQLLAAFEEGDHRRTVWVDSVMTDRLFYFPFKYTVNLGELGIDVLQHYMVLRLAEQYLIRAEARAQQNNTEAAISDINTIRTRAGLPGLENTLTQDEVLAAVAHERQIELFSEWGHRWFDLKEPAGHLLF